MEKNIIIITLDGLRRDKIEKIPTLKKITKNSLFFSNVITAVPYTIGSLTSMMTGLYPYYHKVNAYYNIFNFDENIAKTLVDYLKEQNYYSIFDAINQNIFPTKKFDEIHKHESESINFSEKLISHIKTGQDKNKPFFVYFQYSKIHLDSLKNTKHLNDFDETYFSDHETNTSKYEKSIEGCDIFLKNLNNYLKETKLDKNTLLIIHSDHGTSCGEKPGEKMYGTYLYDYTTKVFFTINGPNIPIKQINSQVRTIDLLPTILELINVKQDKNKKIQGVSLIEKEKITERPAYFETGGLGGPNPSPKRHNIFGLRYKNLKIIFNKSENKWEYYNLNNDPKEKLNIYKTEIAKKNDSKFIELKILLKKHLIKQKDLFPEKIISTI